VRRLSGCLLVLVCAVVLLGAGSLLPRLAFSHEGVGGYAGEKRAFARFALVYDLGLREWPFPVDPTVARRVTKVSGNRDAGSPCRSQEVPKGGPYHTGYFAGDYRAEVVHYGPFFVPTGSNVFDCDGARTYSFFLPGGPDGALFSVLGPLVFAGAVGLAMAALVVPLFLVLGGGLLIAKGSERNHRAVGLVAGLLGFVLAAVVFLSAATTPI
jgi:hypothetical protein